MREQKEQHEDLTKRHHQALNDIESLEKEVSALKDDKVGLNQQIELQSKEFTEIESYVEQLEKLVEKHEKTIEGLNDKSKIQRAEYAAQELYIMKLKMDIENMNKGQLGEERQKEWNAREEVLRIVREENNKVHKQLKASLKRLHEVEEKLKEREA